MANETKQAQHGSKVDDLDSGTGVHAIPVGLRLQQLAAQAPEISSRIHQKFQDLSVVHDRMDADYSLYTLDRWQPDLVDALSPEDIYTTNEPTLTFNQFLTEQFDPRRALLQLPGNRTDVAAGGTVFSL